MKYIIFEEKWGDFYPVTLTRGVFDILFGMFNQKERAEREFGALFENWTERDYIEKCILPDEETLFLNARAHIWDIKEKIKEKGIYKSGNEIIAVYGKGITPEYIPENVKIFYIDVPVFNNIFDILKFNQKAIKLDISRYCDIKQKKNPPNIHSINPDEIFISENAKIYGNITIDASNGPILIEKNVTIEPYTYLKGPLFIGKNSLIKAYARISKSSIGKVSKVSGEIEESIIQGYSNKQHYGFLGHSYLGEWVNLGAGTTNSDLKNNYSPVSVNISGKKLNTGLQFLGSIIGDHTKTGIGTILNTGTIIGVSCNIFGEGFPPKYIPSFSWGGASGFKTYNMEKAIKTAEIVMGRRNIKMDKKYRDMMKRIYEMTKEERNTIIASKDMGHS